MRRARQGRRELLAMKVGLKPASIQRSAKLVCEYARIVTSWVPLCSPVLPDLRRRGRSRAMFFDENSPARR